MESNVELVQFLHKIGTIKKGQTYSLANGCVVNHEAWSTTLSRLWYREDRTSLLTELENKIPVAIFNLIRNEDPVLDNALKAVLPGLKSLIETYKEDHVTVNRLSLLISGIERYQERIKSVPVTPLLRGVYGVRNPV